MSCFILYEVTSFNDVEIKKEHTVKEVLDLDGALGDVMVGYFDDFDGGLKNNVNEGNHYISLWGEDLFRLINLLEDSLKIDGGDNYWYLFLRCVKFFPISFSEDYFSILEELYDVLKDIVPSGSVHNRERLFLYRVVR